MVDSSFTSDKAKIRCDQVIFASLMSVRVCFFAGKTLSTPNSNCNPNLHETQIV